MNPIIDFKSVLLLKKYKTIPVILDKNNKGTWIIAGNKSPTIKK